MKFLEELAARRRFGMRPGLDTISRLCAALGNPQRQFPAIHVAGTNGKGAVCAMLDAALRESGLRIGRYTSPHLISLNERFVLDGHPVDDATLERHAVRVESELKDDEEVTFFEALTAAAFSLYATECVDVAILECGLGGRLDATNVCNPAVTAITRIGLDHCDWLGDTLEKIAAEKAGIIKPGVPIVLGENVPAVQAVVRARAKELEAPYYYAPDWTRAAEIPADFSLAGSFNRENAITALTVLKVWLQNFKFPGSVPALANLLPGFAKVYWPGRFQVIGDFIVDGAHNPPAAQALAAALRDRGFSESSALNLIFGACGDKDVETVLATLKPFIGRGYAVRTNNPRSLTPEVLSAKMSAAGIPTVACPTLAAALAAVSGPTLICGSLFLAGEAIAALGAAGKHSRFDPSESLRGF